MASLTLGLTLTLQLRAQERMTVRLAPSLERARDLAAQLQRAEQERDALMAEADDLRTQLREAGKAQGNMSELVGPLEAAQLAAGLIPLSGPGVTVTLND